GHMDSVFGRIKISAIIIMLFSLTSCARFIFPEFKVEKLEHDDNQIKIYFSSEPDVISVKKAFQFIKDDYTEDGTFSFSGKKAVFTPFNKIEENHDYSITITTDAESINGESLQNKYSLSFSTKIKNSPLKIEQIITPQPISQQTEDYILISFSESVKPDVFSSSFSLTPSEPYFAIWNSDFTEVQIKFHSNLKNNQRYIISIDKSLCDIYNNHLESSFTESFINKPFQKLTEYKVTAISGNDNSSTELIREATAEGISCDSKIQIIFDNQIELDTTVSAISIIPQISFTIEKNIKSQNELTVVFSSKPSYGKTYKLKIADSITDINQNRLSPSEYCFKFSNPKDENVSFSACIIELQNDMYILGTNSNYKTIIFPVNIYPTVNTISSPDINFYFIFKISEKAEEINLLSAMENITVSKTNNCIDFSPYKIEQITKEQFTQNPLYESLFQNYSSFTGDTQEIQHNFCVIKFCSTVQNNDNTGLIKIGVSKDLCDNLSNKIEGPVNISINKK
ncbi:MAG: Ig-like domain-containing protein, partial [Treponema sp.]|nr:Ig-like domain-containing protein [Treponema sp.]